MTADEQRLCALADGSHQAFEEFFDAYADFVFNVAFRRTGAAEAAEDIVADVFAELWRQRGRIETKYGSLQPWLAGTATNRARRFWRSSDRRSRALSKLNGQSEVSVEDFADATIIRIDEARRYTRLAEALSALPSEQFDVLTLSVWEQLTHVEIAEALGIAVGTVKSRLSRARRQIERTIGTGAPLRAWPGDCPTGAVGGQPTIEVEGGCS